MENQTDYEKAKAEAWTKFYDEELEGRPQWEPISDKQVFDYAFKAAYRYGVQCGMERGADNIAAEHTSRATETENETKENEKSFASERIMIAAMAMQGMLACGDEREADIVAGAAVFYADNLIAELVERKNDDQ